MKKEKGQTFCDTSLNHCPFRFYGFRRRQRTERVLYHADCNRRPTHHLKGLCPLHSRILALLHHSAEKIARSGINDPHRLRSSQQIIRCSSDGKGTGISRHVAQSLPLSILWLLQTATYRTCSVPCQLQPPPHPPPQRALPSALPYYYISPETFRVRTRFFSCIASLSCASFSICFRT